MTIIGTVLSTNVNIVLQQGFTLLGSLVSLYRLSPRLALFYMLVSALWVSCTKKFGAYQQMLQRPPHCRAIRWSFGDIIVPLEA